MHRCVIIVLLSLLSLLNITSGELGPPEDSYNICILISFVGHSHKAFIFTLAEELLNRGHKITVLSGLPPSLNHANATEIHHSVPIHTTETRNKFEESSNKATFSFFEEHLGALARDLYKDAKVKNLFDRREEFDLFLTDVSFNEQTYPFLFGKAFILLAPIGKLPTVLASQGNPMNPSYTPVFNEYPRPWSFLSRISCLYDNLHFYKVWRRGVVSRIQREISSQFPDLPPILDIEKNSSLVLLNSHHILDHASPLLPSQIEVACIQCRPLKSIPKDILDWIEGAGDTGVLYFSIGSITRGNSMPNHFKEIFIKAFAKLKLRVIWKFEEEIPNLPSNVFIRKWMPQQDIIAHPSVNVFMSHCGLLGYEEAVYHATPLVALPIQADQIKYSSNIVAKGFGVRLLWNELSVDSVVAAIEEVYHNSSYKENISKASKILKDRPMSPKDTAVWWTEYVIRNKGAQNLRSPAASLTWVEFLMIDIIIFMHLIIFVFVCVVKRVVKWMLPCKITKNKMQ